MIAEHPSVYRSTSSTATFGAAAVQHHPSAVTMMVHRVADTCRSWMKAPALPYAELWEASFVVGPLSRARAPPATGRRRRAAGVPDGCVAVRLAEACTTTDRTDLLACGEARTSLCVYPLVRPVDVSEISELNT